jgi:hypothetical protein
MRWIARVVSRRLLGKNWCDPAPSPYSPGERVKVKESVPRVFEAYGGHNANER